MFRRGWRLAGWFLGIMFILTVLILWAPTRTIHLETRSLSARVVLNDQILDWDLTGAHVCRPNFAIEDDGDTICGPGYDWDTEQLPEPVTWTKDQSLDLRWTRDRVPENAPPGTIPDEWLRIELLTKSEANDWNKGTVLYLSDDDFANNGAILLAGALTIGEEVRSGTDGYLLDGRYSIIEISPFVRLLGGAPQITREGQLRRGDELRIVCQQSWFRTCASEAFEDRPNVHPNPTYGSITPSFDADLERGLHVVATGSEENTRLEVTFFGRDEPFQIHSTFVQRAAASAHLLVISLLIAIFGPFVFALLERREP